MNEAKTQWEAMVNKRGSHSITNQLETRELAEIWVAEMVKNGYVKLKISRIK